MRDPRLNNPQPREARELQATMSNIAFRSGLQNGTEVSSSQPERSTAKSVTYSLEQTQRGEVGRLRPRTAAGMNGAYDELYRSQMNGDTDITSRDPSPGPPRTRTILPQNLTRARSDIGPRQDAEDTDGDRKPKDGAVWKMRHGWEDEHTSSEYLSLLTSVSSYIE